MLEHPFFCRCTFIFMFFFIGGQTAFAQSCFVDGGRYDLIEETINWSMTITNGRSCVQGIRFANVEIESLRLISPPQFGKVALHGSGFTYSTKANAVGKDSFILAVTGAINKRRGSSTIRVAVSIGDSKEPASPGSVDRTAPPPEIPRAQAQPEIKSDVSSPKSAALPPCPRWDWSRGSPPPMRAPFDRSRLYCPPSSFKPPHPPVGCICPT